MIGVSEAEPNEQEKAGALAALQNLKTDKCKEVLESEFNLVSFQSGLASALVSGEFSSVALRSEFAALNAYAENKDFSGMKAYIGWLISNGIVILYDYSVVNAVTKLQGIDLDTYAYENPLRENGGARSFSGQGLGLF